MFQDNLKGFGASLGLGTQLDNYHSLKFNAYSNQGATTAQEYPPNVSTGVLTGLIGGNGISNNMPFAIAANTQNEGDEAQPNANFLYGTYNNGYYSD